MSFVFHKLLIKMNIATMATLTGVTAAFVSFQRQSLSISPTQNGITAQRWQ
jgi:hypothetical protein